MPKLSSAAVCKFEQTHFRIIIFSYLSTFVQCRRTGEELSGSLKSRNVVDINIVKYL